MTAAGMSVELALVDGPYGLPVCLAYLWSEDFPVVFAGGGCHTSPVIALTRALTEAAQSRLTAIAGHATTSRVIPARSTSLPSAQRAGTGLLRGRRHRPASSRFPAASPARPGR
ncbi:YcaO-like family protein [Streptomyces sp. NPDC050509]|uniref:YcaO-like family protein n=1 Tax=Streptomyces sp. NPDC050509 TaxID=3365620 RepID=UPI0037B339FB